MRLSAAAAFAARTVAARAAFHRILALAVPQREQARAHFRVETGRILILKQRGRWGMEGHMNRRQEAAYARSEGADTG